MLNKNEIMALKRVVSCGAAELCRTIPLTDNSIRDAIVLKNIKGLYAFYSFLAKSYSIPTHIHVYHTEEGVSYDEQYSSFLAAGAC